VLVLVLELRMSNLGPTEGRPITWRSPFDLSQKFTGYATLVRRFQVAVIAISSMNRLFASL
jgi:hypothetical protein